jgi:hypothetical protein
MAKLPAYGRELQELRRFGDRRPPLNTLLVTSTWSVAEIHRHCDGVALVVDPRDRYTFADIRDLDVLLVMDRPSIELLRALERGRPRNVNRVGVNEWLDIVKALVMKWKKAA